MTPSRSPKSGPERLPLQFLPDFTKTRPDFTKNSHVEDQNAPKNIGSDRQLIPWRVAIILVLENPECAVATTSHPSDIETLLGGGFAEISCFEGSGTNFST